MWFSPLTQISAPLWSGNFHSIEYRSQQVTILFSHHVKLFRLYSLNIQFPVSSLSSLLLNITFTSFFDQITFTLSLSTVYFSIRLLAWFTFKHKLLTSLRLNLFFMSIAQTHTRTFWLFSKYIQIILLISHFYYKVKVQTLPKSASHGF
jgi:hypothetical protein